MMMVRMEERAVEMAVVSKDYPLLVEVTLYLLQYSVSKVHLEAANIILL